MRQRRIHTLDFKLQVVREFLGKRAGVAQLARQYELSPNLIRLWVSKHEHGELASGPGAEVREKLLEARVAELERKIGQLTMENDWLKKAEVFSRRKQNASSLIISGPAPSARKRSAK